MQLPQFQIHAAIEEKHWWFLGRRTLFRALLHTVVPPNTGKKLLEVGSGTGGNVAAFSQEYDCIGVEPIAEAVQFAKQRFPDCRFIQGFAPRDVQKEIGEADVVLLADVLEHVEDDIDLVSNLLAAMKPGAYMLMMAPADMALWSPHDRGFEHFRRYDLARARKLWEGKPVTELVCSYVNARLYWPIRIVRMLTKFFGKSFGPSDTDLSLPPAPVNALLRKLFESEAGRLREMLRQPGMKGFRHGVSFIALLRRK
ncbi:MAG: class I SAM-dependent methyltransferase [Candidatus Peregrinibacteria bacterium]|nr:class I SAM-dependent methyltransferase [Candidatus Peregrinibacteria bacterium]